MRPVLLPPSVLLPNCPDNSSLFLNITHPSFRHITSFFVYIFYFVLMFTIILAILLGLSKADITCFPVHKATGFIIVGGGKFMSYAASAK